MSKTLAVELLAILARDEDRLELIDRYIRGNHDGPYMPASADGEYKLLARRSVSNWMPLLIDTPAQALYVDGYRPGRVTELDEESIRTLPEWQHWQRSRLDARQVAVHREALGYGHSFVLTEGEDDVLSKGLSARNTTAIFGDPANDITPQAALTVINWNSGEGEKSLARMWDASSEFLVTFRGLQDENSVSVTEIGPHGAPECPVTRFPCHVDLQGRTTGVVEPMIPIQNRLNQTVFDLLVAQTYGSFKIRWVTGMAPPIQRDEDGNPVLDASGNPIPAPVDMNARRIWFGEDPDTRFGSLDHTPLDGYLAAIEASIKHLAAISQTPPHYLLGQIANLSAEALIAAETSLARKVQEFRNGFGESWERVFQLAGAMSGQTFVENDFSGEVQWRDMESRSLAQSADALGKLAAQLGIPVRGLWDRVPGVTNQELARWEKLAEEADSERILAEALARATAPVEGEST